MYPHGHRGVIADLSKRVFSMSCRAQTRLWLGRRDCPSQLATASKIQAKKTPADGIEQCAHIQWLKRSMPQSLDAVSLSLIRVSNSMQLFQNTMFWTRDRGEKWTTCIVHWPRWFMATCHSIAKRLPSAINIWEVVQVYGRCWVLSWFCSVKRRYTWTRMPPDQLSLMARAKIE